MGKPESEIMKRAIIGGADVIVMPTHGRTGLARFVFGFVAEKFMQKSQCPLLTVPIAPTHSTECVEKYLG